MYSCSSAISWKISWNDNEDCSYCYRFRICRTFSVRVWTVYNCSLTTVPHTFPTIAQDRGRQIGNRLGRQESNFLSNGCQTTTADPTVCPIVNNLRRGTRRHQTSSSVIGVAGRSYVLHLNSSSSILLCSTGAPCKPTSIRRVFPLTIHMRTWLVDIPRWLRSHAS